MDYDQLLDELATDAPALTAGEIPPPTEAPAAIRPQMTALSREFQSRHMRPALGAHSSVFQSVSGIRSIMNREDRRSLDADLNANGYMTIESVRSLIHQEGVKETMNARGETFAPDPEVMIVICSRTNYPIFIHGDNVYTREELMNIYPFEQLKATPEQIFVRQEIGVFPGKKHALPGAGFEYQTRDVGDSSEFIMLEDMVGKATKPSYKPKRAPLKVITTNIYLGRESWEDFKLLLRMTRSVSSIRLLTGGGSPMALLMDDSTLEAQRARLREAEQAQAAREQRLRETEARIAADIQRLEKLWARGASGTAAPAAPTTTAARDISGSAAPSSVTLEEVAEY